MGSYPRSCSQWPRLFDHIMADMQTNMAVNKVLAQNELDNQAASMAIEKEAIKQKCPIFDPLFKRVRTWSPEQQHEFQEYYLSQIAQRNTRQSTELLAKHMEQERKNMEAATLLEGSMMSMERKTAEFLAFKAKEDAYVIRQKEAKMRDLQMKAKLQACSAEAEKVRERLGLQYLSRKKEDEFRLQRELKDRERKLIQTKIKQCFFDTCACMGSDDSSTDSESCDSEKGQDGQCFCSEEKNEPLGRCFCTPQPNRENPKGGKCHCDPRSGPKTDREPSAKDAGTCLCTPVDSLLKPEKSETGKCLCTPRKNTTDICCSYGDVKNSNTTTYENLTMDHVQCKEPKESEKLELYKVPNDCKVQMKKLSQNHVELVVAHCSCSPRKKRTSTSPKPTSTTRHQPRQSRSQSRKSFSRLTKRYYSQPGVDRYNKINACYNNSCSPGNSYRSPEAMKPLQRRNEKSKSQDNQRDYFLAHCLCSLEGDANQHQNMQNEAESHNYYNDGTPESYDSPEQNYRSRRKSGKPEKHFRSCTCRERTARKRDYRDTQSESEQESSDSFRRSKKHHKRSRRCNCSCNRGNGNEMGNREQPDAQYQQQQSSNGNEIVYLIYQNLPGDHPSAPVMQQNEPAQMNEVPTPVQQSQPQQQLQPQQFQPEPQYLPEQQYQYQQMTTYGSPGPSQPFQPSNGEENSNMEEVKKLIVKAQNKMLKDLLSGKSLEEMKKERDKYLKKRSQFSIFDQGDCRPCCYGGMSQNARDSQYYEDQYRLRFQQRYSSQNSNPNMAGPSQQNGSQYPVQIVTCCCPPQYQTQNGPPGSSSNGFMQPNPNYFNQQVDTGTSMQTNNSLSASNQQFGGRTDAFCQCTPEPNRESSPNSTFIVTSHPISNQTLALQENSGSCLCVDETQNRNDTSTQYEPQCYCVSNEETNTSYQDDSYNRYSKPRNRSRQRSRPRGSSWRTEGSTRDRRSRPPSAAPPPRRSTRRPPSRQSRRSPSRTYTRGSSFQRTSTRGTSWQSRRRSPPEQSPRRATRYSRRSSPVRRSTRGMSGQSRSSPSELAGRGTRKTRSTIPKSRKPTSNVRETQRYPSMASYGSKQSEHHPPNEQPPRPANSTKPPSSQGSVRPPSSGSTGYQRPPPSMSGSGKPPSAGSSGSFEKKPPPGSQTESGAARGASSAAQGEGKPPASKVDFDSESDFGSSTQNSSMGKPGEGGSEGKPPSNASSAGNETYRVSKEGEPGKDGAGNSMSSKNFSASNSKDQDDLSKSVVGSGSGQKPPDDKSKPGSDNDLSNVSQLSGKSGAGSAAGSDRLLSQATEDGEEDESESDSDGDDDTDKPAFSSDDYYGKSNNSKAISGGTKFGASQDQPPPGGSTASKSGGTLGADPSSGSVEKSLGTLGSDPSAGSTGKPSGSLGGNPSTGSAAKTGDSIGDTKSLGSIESTTDELGTSASGSTEGGGTTDDDLTNDTVGDAGQKTTGFGETLSTGTATEGKPTEDFGENPSSGSVGKSTEEPVKSFNEKPSDDLKTNSRMDQSDNRKKTYKPKVRIFSKSKKPKK